MGKSWKENSWKDNHEHEDKTFRKNRRKREVQIPRDNEDQKDHEERQFNT